MLSREENEINEDTSVTDAHLRPGAPTEISIFLCPVKANRRHQAHVIYNRSRDCLLKTREMHLKLGMAGELRK